MTIYERIKYLRENLNMSQQELAAKVGYKDKSAISKVERGDRDINQTMIKKYANALGVTPTYILFGDEPINEETPTPELTEGERAWLELYRKLTPGVRELFFPMLEKFDELPDSERQMLLAMISAAVKTK
jgi:transcriptional regulator with XRE-family HTH domain